jgi:hypothetical protein
VGDIMIKVDYIKQMPLFYNFSQIDVEKASLFSIEKTLNRGSFIFMEGDNYGTINLSKVRTGTLEN